MDEEATEPRQGHRADIQGLRAIAIVLVVVCHTGLALPGGFVGVDVFFVVSGFVIGALLLRELEATGTVSLRTFYARRARRLLPALAAVILVSLAVGIVVLNPQVQQATPFKTAGTASVFASNAYLYRHLGYFDGDSELVNPFLHLWSLSVEEQFYLVLPLLLLVGWRWGRDRTRRASKRRAAVVVAVASAGSFWLSWAMTSGRSPLELQAPERFAFYGSPTRLWELGAGVLAAFAATRLGRLPPAVRAASVALGLVAIGAAALLTDPLQPFPGLRALPPVAGTVLLIAGGAGDASTSSASRWLGARGLCWLGDRSYGWYLWHWPAIVYARVLWPDAAVAPVVAAATSLGLAALTFSLFEDRVRRNPALVGWPALRLGVSCVLVALLGSLGALHGAGKGWGVERPVDWGYQSAGRGAGCLVFNVDLASAWPADACTTEPPGGRPAGTVLILGDNQADAVSPGVLQAAAGRRLRVAQWTRSGCPFVAAVPEAYPRCAEWQRDAMALVDRLHPDLVVLGSRSTAYTTAPDAGGIALARKLVAPDGRVATSVASSLDLWEQALRSTVQQLRERGAAVVVVGGAPVYGSAFPSPSVVRPSTDPPILDRAAVGEVHDPVVVAERGALRGIDRVAYVDPVSTLCRRTCSPFLQGRWRYLDGYDLNQFGAQLLTPAIDRAIGRASLPPR